MWFAALDVAPRQKFLEHIFFFLCVGWGKFLQRCVKIVPGNKKWCCTTSAVLETIMRLLLSL